MIKTRKVKVIGSLYLQNNLEYLLIRQEELGPGFTGQIAGFTVTSNFKKYRGDMDWPTDDDVYYIAPFFVVATQYTIVYNRKPFEIAVEDDLEDEEVDATDIPPEPEMTEQEWIDNLNRVDKENLNENSQA